MKSIYIESEKIRERKDIIEWLDGCGATIKHLKNIIENTYIIFGVSKANGIKYWKYNMFLTEAQSAESMQCTTALGFCQGVARIMGIPEPTFGEINDHTESHLKPEPIKGMAIDINLLGENEREYIDSIYGDSSVWQEKYDYCIYYPGNLQKSNPLRFNFFSQGHYFLNDLTITESPKVFMEYVAQQTGKKYPTISKMETVEHVNNSYKFKTYRILDSLDGIPLDTRFKFSEWIPPFGEGVLVMSESIFFGSLELTQKEGIYFKRPERNLLQQASLDGEWMRIV